MSNNYAEPSDGSYIQPRAPRLKIYFFCVDSEGSQAYQFPIPPIPSLRVSVFLWSLESPRSSILPRLTLGCPLPKSVTVDWTRLAPDSRELCNTRYSTQFRKSKEDHFPYLTNCVQIFQEVSKVSIIDEQVITFPGLRARIKKISRTDDRVTEQTASKFSIPSSSNRLTTGLLRPAWFLMGNLGTSELQRV